MTTLFFAALLALSPALQIEDMQGQLDQQALIERIKENQKKIDEMLMHASEVDVVKDEIADARQKHLDVIRDIEELIKQVKYQQSNQSSGGGGGSPQQSSSSDSQDQQQQQPRDSDGSQQRDQQDNPSQDGSQQQPKDGEGEKDEQKDGGRKDQASPDSLPPNAGTADAPPPDDTSPFQRSDTDGRWGLLPPKVQEQLMNLHVDDVPDQYRAWFEAYIKAMHELEKP